MEWAGLADLLLSDWPLCAPPPRLNSTLKCFSLFGRSRSSATRCFQSFFSLPCFWVLNRKPQEGRKQGRRQGKEGSDWDLIGCHRVATLHFVSRETKVQNYRVAFCSVPLCCLYQLPPPWTPSSWTSCLTLPLCPHPHHYCKPYQAMSARGPLLPFFWIRPV